MAFRQDSSQSQGTSHSGLFPYKLEWKKGQSALKKMSAPIDAAVHGTIAYFRPYRSREIYSFNCQNQEWSHLSDCACRVKDTSLVMLPRAVDCCAEFVLCTIGGIKREIDRKHKDDSYTNALFQLQLDQKVWIPSDTYPNMPTERSQVTAVYTDQMLIAVGGRNSTGVAAIVEVFHSINCVWYRIADLPRTVYRASGCVCQQKLFILGGCDMSKTGPIPLNIAYEIDLHNLTLACTGQAPPDIYKKIMPVPLYDSTFVSVYGFILAIGGSENKRLVSSSKVHSYHPLTQSWHLLSSSSLLEKRSFPFSVTFNEGKSIDIVVVGGYTMQPDVDCTDSMETVTLTPMIGQNEAVLLGNILRKLKVDLKGFGVDVQLLCSGESKVSYKEMEQIMKENPATKFLEKDLEKELVSRNEEERLYNEAMAENLTISLSYTRILALGPGQVGKSTFLYRLLGLMKGNIKTSDPETQPQSSTGAAELREAACITYTSRTCGLSLGKWHLFDEKNGLQTQLKWLMSLIKENPNSIPQTKQEAAIEEDPEIVPLNPNSKQSQTKSLPQSKDEISSFTEEQELSYEQKFAPSKRSPIQSQSVIVSDIYQYFIKLQDDCKVTSEQTKCMDFMLFNIADIGGQPAFLEMLPSLTIGPALYLVFMKLTQGLTTQYPVLFNCKSQSQQTLCKKYTYTSEEVIFTALSSIACFGHSDDDIRKYIIESDSENAKVTSLALLVGTFVDEIKENSELDDIDHSLKLRLKETSFYDDGLIYSTSFMRVNNYDAKETEIDEHRNLLSNILQNKFTKYQIPTRWLSLSICLKLLGQKQKRYDIPFNDCIELGKLFGMEKDMVKVALQFLHKYVGLVMYFPHNEHLKDVVICDPQVVFSSISELIFNIYDPKKLHITEAQCEYFIRTGCFSPQDIKDKRQSYEKKQFLPVNTLIDLLVHLNIAAEVPSSIDETKRLESKQVFFLPAVLQTAKTPLLVMEPSDEPLPEPLCIRFPFGYLPLGFVCALSANLLGEKQIDLLISNDDRQITYKNKIRFRFQGTFDIVMISCPKYCEFRVNKCLKYTTTEFWASDCCPAIRTLICDAADRVIKSMQNGSLYKEAKKYNYNLAFKCPLHKEENLNVGHEPLAVISVNKDTPELTKCTICNIKSPLTPKMKMWFGEGPNTQPPTIELQPTIEDNKIEVLVNGSKPITYQWFKNKKCICDWDVKYKGSDTAELVVLGSDQQVKGKYQCLIKNKYGEIWSNESDDYDPLEVELCQKGLKKKVARELILNVGVESFEDVQQIEENDLKRTSLSDFEKRKLLKFIFLLNTSSEIDTAESSITTNSNLTTNDVNKIFQKLEKGSVKWFELGLALDIHNDNLEKIKDKERDCDKCLRAMIVKRVRSSARIGVLTWRVICEALKTPTVARDDIAEAIEKAIAHGDL